MKKESMENKNNNGGTGSGFLLGLLIGMLLTLLITTKKGREILRDVIDKVIRKISALDEVDKEMENMQDFNAENDFVYPTTEEIKKENNQIQNIKILAQAEKDEVKESNEKPEKMHKRLFLRRHPK